MMNEYFFETIYIFIFPNKMSLLTDQTQITSNYYQQNIQHYVLKAQESLGQAIVSDQESICVNALDAGANINLKEYNPYDGTLQFVGSFRGGKGQPQIVYTDDAFLCTPLFLAIKQNKLKIVQVLLNNDVSIYKGGTWGQNRTGSGRQQSPLELAFENGNQEIYTLIRTKFLELEANKRSVHVDDLPYSFVGRYPLLCKKGRALPRGR